MEIQALEPRQQSKLFNAKPQEMIQAATEYAKVLANVIQQQGLYVTMAGKPHVKIEGWTTLGTMLGILPREKSVFRHDDGTYEATVELYNMHTGAIVGQASSICGMDETRWAKQPNYSRRSMAITRATGKAYRLGFGWVMAMAGYETTPADEIPHEDETPAPAPKAKKPEKKVEPAAEKKDPSSWIYTGTTEQQKWVETYLRKNSIPEEKWEAVHEKMIGKPGSALTEVMHEVANAGIFS